MFSSIRALVPALLGGLLLAACQSYSPRPLDDAAHDRAWHARSVNGAGVREFAAALSQRDARPRRYDPSDGLDLEEAEVVALFFNAGLRRARLEAGAALAGARHAGEWENPELNVSAGVILASIAQPWMASAGLEFTVPISGRKGVERDLAFAEHEVKWREVLAQEWAVIVDLRKLWREQAALNERVLLLEAHSAGLSDVGRRAADLALASELARTDARLFEIELLQSRIELEDLRAQSREQQCAILGLLGLAPAAPLRLNLTLGASLDRRPHGEWPPVSVARAAYSVAEQQLRLEIRKQYPDLRIGPGYGIDEGQSTISLGFGLPLPLINLNRAGIARARVAREAARAAYEQAREEAAVSAELARLRLERVRAARRQVEDELAPLVDLQVKEARQRAEAGDFDALLMLEALKSLREAKERVLQTRLHEAQAMDALNALKGPTFKPKDNK